MMKNMQTISDYYLAQGQVWIAPVWSCKDRKFKPRPVVIVGNESANDKLDVVLNFITSQGARGDFDVELTFRDETGLDVPSWVRTAKTFTIQKSQLRTQMIEREGVTQPKGYIGRLNEIDLANVIEMCRLVF
ncbi:type II toxin-antitoxin system PemK/MazF family toxin [Sutcliffiella horikoshii]|uniref:type II toxin-antitoxin system PemK/MazF family toxin n=1 Tax=Sutcliffiella horikoshii TaxID=79883 RepID=UPI003CE7DB64